jgi:hypothetical protein
VRRAVARSIFMAVVMAGGKKSVVRNGGMKAVVRNGRKDTTNYYYPMNTTTRQMTNDRQQSSV